MSQAVTVAATPASEIIEQVLIKGDLEKLSPTERTRYYMEVCRSVGLNPLTKPFEYIKLNNKLTLYALRTCTDQLRAIHGVSVEELSESERNDVYVVTAKVRNKEGRTDMAKGAVTLGQLKGDALANAMMKAETKAKRRATLSICGLGFLDETEIETIPANVRSPGPAVEIAAPTIEVPHDPETGEITPHAIQVPIASGNKADWVGWGGQLIAAFKACTTRQELAAWAWENNAALNNCMKNAPKAYASILRAQAAMEKSLPGPEAEPDFIPAADEDPLTDGV